MQHLMFGLFALFGVVIAAPLFADCAPDAVEFKLATGKVRFSVEVADTADERSQGLMFRKSLPRSAGMLFIYETEGSASFWMKNTLIPLDMVFADATGRVVRVHSNAKPQDTTSIPGGDHVLMVLEINGGLADRLGLVEGSQLRYPGLDQSQAVWPCSAP